MRCWRELRDLVACCNAFGSSLKACALWQDYGKDCDRLRATTGMVAYYLQLASVNHIVEEWRNRIFG
jgi:hypothetical protein